MTLNPFAGPPRQGENETEFGLRMLEHERRDAKTMCPINTYYPDHHTKRHTLRLKCPVDVRVTDKKLSLQQKTIISHLTLNGPATVRDISFATGMNANSVSSNVSHLCKASLVRKLHNIRVNGKTVATGRVDCWVYGPASARKEA
tara:strand:- start:93 stop:527 length:435 start_codon:yes stop_codon:yes gene_type:complete